MMRLLMGFAAAAAMVLTVPALGQQSDKKVQIPAKTFYKGQEAKQYLVRDRLIGAKVQNKDGQVIGDIEDVVLGSNNQVEGVIMGVGGFLGVGEKKIGVRYSALKFETKDGKRTVTLPGASKEVLAELKPYERSEAKPTLLQKAGELSKKASAAAKGAYEKAKESVKPSEQPKKQ